MKRQNDNSDKQHRPVSGFNTWGRPIIAGLFLLSLQGCALFVVGTAATGVGIYSYTNGELTRSYQTSYEQAVAASVAAMKGMDIHVTNQNDSGLVTTVAGEYFNGKPITVKVSRLDAAITRVGVRSGFFGIWDKPFSEQIHARIAERL